MRVSSGVWGLQLQPGFGNNIYTLMHGTVKIVWVLNGVSTLGGFPWSPAIRGRADVIISGSACVIAAPARRWQTAACCPAQWMTALQHMRRETLSSIYPRLRLRSKVGSRYIVRPVFNKSIDEDDEVLEIDIVKRVEIDTSATSSTTSGTGFESLIF